MVMNLSSTYVLDRIGTIKGALKIQLYSVFYVTVFLFVEQSQQRSVRIIFHV